MAVTSCGWRMADEENREPTEPKRDWAKFSASMDEFLAEEAKPVVLHPESGDWISAREARILVSKLAEVFHRDAEIAILRRALRWVPVTVETFSRLAKPHDYIKSDDFNRDFGSRLTHFRPTPSKSDWREAIAFFEALIEYIPILNSAGVQHAHWATGDFKVVIEKDFSDVIIDVTGLAFDRPALLASLGIASTKLAPRARLSPSEICEWIMICGTENSKLAWKKIKAEFGGNAPKKYEEFDPAWKSVKGTRTRGRPPRNLSQK